MRDGFESAGDLLHIRADLYPKVLRVHPDEVLGCLIGLGKPFQGPSHFFHVAERACSLEHQLLVERTQPVGQCLRQPLRVEVLRQLGSAQGQDEIDQLVVALRTEAEHTGVDRRPIVHRAVGQCIRPELIRQLFLGERTVVGPEQ